jgi:hypothetical protein
VTGCTRVRAADRLHARLGETEVPHLARLDELLDGAGHVLDRDVRVDAVLVQQVDRVGAEPLQRALDTALDRLRATVESAGHAALEVEAELRRDHDLVADRLERLADELLVGEGPVDLRGVEEGDAALDGRADDGDPFVLRRDRREALTQSHAAEPDRGDLQVGSERALLHLRLLLMQYVGSIVGDGERGTAPVDERRVGSSADPGVCRPLKQRALRP